MALVHDDLMWRRGKPAVDPNKGRRGLSAEQVLRALVVKKLNRCSYEQLAFHLADSRTYRRFCRLGIDDAAPSKSRLQKNIKRVRAETWETINQMVVRKAEELGIETRDKVRTDCTVVDANIHSPTDSTLLWDSVRVLARLMGDASELFGVTFQQPHSTCQAPRHGDLERQEYGQARAAVPRSIEGHTQHRDPRRACGR